MSSLWHRTTRGNNVVIKRCRCWAGKGVTGRWGQLWRSTARRWSMMTTTTRVHIQQKPAHTKTFRGTDWAGSHQKFQRNEVHSTYSWRKTKQSSQGSSQGSLSISGVTLVVILEEHLAISPMKKSSDTNLNVRQIYIYRIWEGRQKNFIFTFNVFWILGSRLPGATVEMKKETNKCQLNMNVSWCYVTERYY